jgi:sugar phosphate isomerase/epimerase
MQETVLGVRSSAWSKKGLTLGEQFQAIASHGFKFVNVIFDPDQSKAERTEAKRIFDDLGLYSGQMGVDVSSYTSAAGPESWKLWIDMGKRKVDFQSELGGKQIVMVAGRYSTDYPWQNAWVDSVRSMQIVCDYAAQAGQYVVIEYEPEIHYVTHTYEGTLTYLTQVDRDNFMVNIDIGHMNCMQTPPRAVHLLRQLIPQCHITDNGGTEHHGGPIGTGTTDIAMWMKALAPFVEETCAQIGEVPSAAIEFGAADPDAEIERIKAHLNSIGVNLPLQF